MNILFILYFWLLFYTFNSSYFCLAYRNQQVSSLFDTKRIRKSNNRLRNEYGTNEEENNHEPIGRKKRNQAINERNRKDWKRSSHSGMNDQTEKPAFKLTPISLPSLLILFGIIGLCISIVYMEKHLNLFQNIFSFLDTELPTLNNTTVDSNDDDNDGDSDSEIIVNNKRKSKKSQKKNTKHMKSRSKRKSKNEKIHSKRHRKHSSKKHHRNYYDDDYENDDDVLTRINTRYNISV